MIIKNTDFEARHPWPENVYLQGGGLGAVLSGDGKHYRTAFVEAFPGETFLRGEGKTLEEAEDKAWAQYTRWADCDGSGEPHGPFERRKYTAGHGFCTRCGIWMMNVLPPIPEPEKTVPSLLERALTGDPEIVLGIIADAENLPEGPDQ